MNRVLVIAEAGVNHNGKIDLALALVDAAAAAGADAVKFQTFRAAELASTAARKAAYQARTTAPDESQLEMLRRLELDEAAHARIAARCREKGVEFMSTPFDPQSVSLLERLGVGRFKVPSGEVTNPLLLRAVARTSKPLIVSTGMCTLGDVEAALTTLAATFVGAAAGADSRAAYASAEGQRALRERVTLLHCTTEYPAPVDEVNLRALQTMASAFLLPVGYSDHTEGIAVPIAATALGATVIEKHFTLDRNLPGPDHRASLEPEQLAAMVRGIRDASRALGSAVKSPTLSELPNLAVARRSLVAARAIRAGEELTSENVTLKRPGTGIPAMRYDEVLGTRARRDYEEDELID